MAVSKRCTRMRRSISRKEAKERVSTAQISVAKELLCTRGFQRGWVSQTISALGKDSRSPATAGNVWTISPREPSRTTRKRCSDMRCLADGFEKLARRVILAVADNRHPDTELRRGGTLRNGIRRVVCALGMDIGAQYFQKRFHVGFGEEHDVIYALERRDELRARAFVQDRTAGPFQ